MKPSEAITALESLLSDDERPQSARIADCRRILREFRMAQQPSNVTIEQLFILAANQIWEIPEGVHEINGHTLQPLEFHFQTNGRSIILDFLDMEYNQKYRAWVHLDVIKVDR